MKCWLITTRSSQRLVDSLIPYQFFFLAVARSCRLKYYAVVSGIAMNIITVSCSLCCICEQLSMHVFVWLLILQLHARLTDRGRCVSCQQCEFFNFILKPVNLFWICMMLGLVAISILDQTCIYPCSWQCRPINCTGCKSINLITWTPRYYSYFLGRSRLNWNEQYI